MFKVGDKVRYRFDLDLQVEVAASPPEIPRLIMFKTTAGGIYFLDDFELIPNVATSAPEEHTESVKKPSKSVDEKEEALRKRWIGPQRHLDATCGYDKKTWVKNGPTLPCDPDHNKMKQGAYEKIKRFVSATYKEWPTCHLGGEVQLYLDFDRANGGDGWMAKGFFRCWKC